MEFSRAVTEAFCSRMTNKCSALHNNIPMHVFKLSIMQLSRRHINDLKMHNNMAIPFFT